MLSSAGSGKNDRRTSEEEAKGKVLFFVLLDDRRPRRLVVREKTRFLAVLFLVDSLVASSPSSPLLPFDDFNAPREVYGSGGPLLRTDYAPRPDENSC